MELAAIDPKVLALAAILIPVVTSFLKSIEAPDWLQSLIYGLLCLVASMAAFFVTMSTDDIPADPQEQFDWWLTALLQILVVSQAFYRGVWKPSGADAAVSRHSPPQLGENMRPTNNPVPLPEEGGPPVAPQVAVSRTGPEPIEPEPPEPVVPRRDNEDTRWDGN